MILWFHSIPASPLAILMIVPKESGVGGDWFHFTWGFAQIRLVPPWKALSRRHLLFFSLSHNLIPALSWPCDLHGLQREMDSFLFSLTREYLCRCTPTTLIPASSSNPIGMAEHCLNLITYPSHSPEHQMSSKEISLLLSMLRERPNALTHAAVSALLAG